MTTEYCSDSTVSYIEICGSITARCSWPHISMIFFTFKSLEKYLENFEPPWILGPNEFESWKHRVEISWNCLFKLEKKYLWRRKQIFLTPHRQWHRQELLYYVNDNAEPDSAVSVIPHCTVYCPCKYIRQVVTLCKHIDTGSRWVRKQNSWHCPFKRRTTRD